MVFNYFNTQRLSQQTLSTSCTWLIEKCMESKGTEKLWIQRRPEILNVLKDEMMVHSVESSNRIEGVEVDKERLRPLILQNARPKDRPEEELAGYKKALDWIFSKKTIGADLSPQVILKLHTFCQGGFCGDAGKWKTRNNEIVEILPNGERFVRFVPLEAKATPGAIEELCRFYSEQIENSIPVLLVIASVVFDFLCIHPFRDGNGRVSRLLTTFLLHHNGFHIVRWVSLERRIEEEKKQYYDTLYQCSQGWKEGKNSVEPWWNFFLSILKNAYQDLSRHIETSTTSSAKSDRIIQCIDQELGIFTLADIAKKCPAVSTQLIKKVLLRKKLAGELSLEGRGRGAKWKRRSPSE